MCVCLLVLCVSVCSKRFSASKLLFVWVRVCFCMSECVLLLTPSDWFTFQSECGSQLIASGLQAYWKVLLFKGGYYNSWILGYYVKIYCKIFKILTLNKLYSIELTLIQCTILILSCIGGVIIWQVKSEWPFQWEPLSCVATHTIKVDVDVWALIAFWQFWRKRWWVQKLLWNAWRKTSVCLLHKKGSTSRISTKIIPKIIVGNI